MCHFAFKIKYENVDGIKNFNVRRNEKYYNIRKFIHMHITVTYVTEKQ